MLAARGLAQDEREALVMRSLSALHEERVEAALQASAALRQGWPEDPVGAVLTANVYQTTMRDYRVRNLEAEFEAALNDALQLARRRVEKAPTAEAFFLLGSARGYRVLHRFSRGEWFSALREALGASGEMRRAHARDPAFVDPLLPLALHDFWKSEKLGLGLGLFSGGRKTVVQRLEAVRRNGRYLQVEAAYSLQTVHLREGRYAEALDVNAGLTARFPHNPVGLYHRGLILEGLRRPREALLAWEALARRIESHALPSDGFLAECHLHRARLYRQLSLSDGAASHSRDAAAALALARAHASRREAQRELEGPFERFDQIRKAIATLSRP
jgi:hypothetical protein